MQSTKDRLIPINVYRNRLPHRVDGTFSVTDNALCDVGKPKGCTEVGVFQQTRCANGPLANSGISCLVSIRNRYPVVLTKHSENNQKETDVTRKSLLLGIVSSSLSTSSDTFLSQQYTGSCMEEGSLISSHADNL